MNKNINRLTVIIFITLIFGISILNAFNPTREFADNENRYLQQFPEFTLKNFWSGEFTEEFEVYNQDQFVFRDNWIMLKAISNLGLMKLENNDVFIGKDDYLFDQFLLFDEERLIENIESINDFEYPVTLMTIPNSNTINSQFLREFSYNTDQLLLLETIDENIDEDVNVINVYDYLISEYDGTEPSNGGYFKTDHHWNNFGSYLGYEALASSWGFEPNDYDMVEVSNDFKGSMFSKSGMFFYSGEALYKINELADMDIEVTFEDGKVMDSVYAEERLQEKDQYTYYLDGNHAITYIVNNDSATDEKILVIKDSYAHIMVPYLVSHYKEIIMVDLRYYKAPVSAIIDEKLIDEILILYSLANLTMDNNLLFLK